MQPFCASAEIVTVAASVDVEVARLFDRVPDHFLVEVLRHLNVRERLLAEGVCRRWRRVALDAAWTHVRAFDYSALIVDGSLSPAPLPDGIQRRQATGLLEAVVERADLRELNLAALRTQHFVSIVSPAFVLRICSLCPALTTLDVSHVQLRNFELCAIGAQLGSRLRSLCLSRCIDDRDLVFPSDFFEPGLSSLFSDCANLEHLDMNRNRRVTGTRSFASLPVTLKSLNVEYCKSLSDAALRNLADRCVALEQLRMANQNILGSAAVQQHVGQLSSLRSFHFTYNLPTLNNNVFFTAVGRLANLQRLDLCNNSLVSDQTLLAVAHGCKQLRTLSLRRCGDTNLTDVGLSALARLPNLTRLELSYCDNMTDAPLIAIANCGKLEVLVVYSCPLVTDAALQRVAWCCEGLRGVVVSECRLVGDATVLALLELVQRRALADPLHVRLYQTAATQPAVVAHANLIIRFKADCCRLLYVLFND